MYGKKEFRVLELHFKKRFSLFVKPENDTSRSEKYRVFAMAKEWLERIATTVKPSTFQKYSGAVERYILPYFGEQSLCEISRTDLVKFGQDCLNHDLSEKTVNDILGVVRMILGYAGREYDLTLPQVSFLRRPPKETRVLTPTEEQRLIQYILRHFDLHGFGILLTLYTGLRIGELCALQWQDVSQTSVKVSKTLQRLSVETGKTALVFGEPKSMNSYRQIPIPDFLQQYIACFRKEEGYVLETKNRTPTEPRTLQAKFSRIAKSCRLEGVTFHTLRHTFATRCVEAGFDLKSLSEILGHRDVKTTMNLYVHPSFDFKKENMEKLKIPQIS